MYRFTLGFAETIIPGLPIFMLQIYSYLYCVYCADLINFPFANESLPCKDVQPIEPPGSRRGSLLDTTKMIRFLDTSTLRKSPLTIRRYE